MTRHPASKSRTGGDDAGFVLVEVLVSAALLILVGLSVFTALNQSDKLAGQQTRRAMAANFAQSEIERIRALPIEDVANLKGTKTVVPDPSRPEDKYFITSQSKWVTDGQDEPECTTRSGGLDYMRITTMVAWAQAGKVLTEDQKKALPKPVVISSIITPAARSASSTNGSLSVNVDRADGKTGVSGLSVTITPVDGGTSYTDSTNINGCVVFPFVPAVQYTLSFSRTGYVDQDSRGPLIEDTVSVPPGATNKVGYLYDLAGTTATKFTTQSAALTLLGTTYTSQTVKSYPKQMVIYNPEQTKGQIVETINGASPGGTDTWDTRKPLFPAESAYSLYAGACVENKPPSNLTNVTITSGQFQNAGATQLPSYDIRVTDGTGTGAFEGSPVGNATVSFFAGCGNTFFDKTQNLGSLDYRTGRLADPGFPYTTNGVLCVSAVISGTRWTWREAAVVNNQFSNPTLRKVILRWNGSGKVTQNGPDCTS